VIRNLSPSQIENLKPKFDTSNRSNADRFQLQKGCLSKIAPGIFLLQPGNYQEKGAKNIMKKQEIFKKSFTKNCLSDKRISKMKKSL